MNTSAALLPVPVLPAPEDRDPLATDHTADAVLALLHSHGWSLVSTPQANVHATSPDGRIYVGWLPEDPTAWQRDIVWRVTVRPTTAPAWTQEFGTATPTEAVASFLTALIAALPRTTR